MRHKQTVWDKLIGRIVIEEHTARRDIRGTAAYVDIQTWRYSECPWIKFLQLARLDNRGFFRTLEKTERIIT